MTERFFFQPNPPLREVLDRFEATPRGVAFVRETAHEFSSLAAVLQNTDEFQGSTFVHEPDGKNVELVNVSKQEFQKAATIVTAANGWTFG